MKKKQENDGAAPVQDPALARRRRAMEVVANFGLLLVAVALVSPIVGFENLVWNVVFKWIYAVGAFGYTVARIVGSLGKDEAFRVRRLRRMEMWAGIAFCVGAFFWFYNTSRIHSDVLTFRMFQETIVFTLVGAIIQIVASWMLSSAIKKQG